MLTVSILSRRFFEGAPENATTSNARSIQSGVLMLRACVRACVSGDPDADGPGSGAQAPGRRLQAGPQQQQLPPPRRRDEHRLRVSALRLAERPGVRQLHQGRHHLY